MSFFVFVANHSMIPTFRRFCNVAKDRWLLGVDVHEREGPHKHCYSRCLEAETTYGTV